MRHANKRDRRDKGSGIGVPLLPCALSLTAASTSNSSLCRSLKPNTPSITQALSTSRTDGAIDFSCIYTYTHIHIHTYTDTDTYGHTYKHTYIHNTETLQGTEATMFRCERINTRQAQNHKDIDDDKNDQLMRRGMLVMDDDDACHFCQ